VCGGREIRWRRGGELGDHKMRKFERESEEKKKSPREKKKEEEEEEEEENGICNMSGWADASGI
jgi:hypothetical protein